MSARHRVGQPHHSCTFANCSSKFSRKDNLQQHIKEIHGFGSTATVQATKDKNAPSPGKLADMTVEMYDQIAEHHFDRSMILQAVSTGNISSFEWALNCGVALSFQGDDGSNALHCAARAGHATVARRLLELGCPSDASNSNGRTPLHEAIIGQNLETVAALLESSPDFQTQDRSGKSAIAHAMECTSRDVCTLLIENMSIEQIMSEKLELLHLAAKYGRDDVVERLLSVPGVLANRKDKKGRAPLHVAAYFGSEAVFKQLVSRDEVSINVKRYRRPFRWEEEGEHTPLYYAARNGHKAIVELLLAFDDLQVKASGSVASPVDIAIINGHPSIAERLLYDDRHQFSSSQNWRGRRTQSCGFCKSVAMNYIDIVKRLLEDHLLELNVSDWDRPQPALYIAVKNNNLNLIGILGQHKSIKVNIATRWDWKGTPSGETPLHRSAADGNFEASRLLLQHGDANPNLQNSAGNTPLHCALLNDHVEVAKLLLAHERLDLRKREPSQCPYGNVGSSIQKESVLEIATRKGQKEIIKLLMSRDDIDPLPSSTEPQLLNANSVEVSDGLWLETSSNAPSADWFELPSREWLNDHFEDSGVPDSHFVSHAASRDFLQVS